MFLTLILQQSFKLSTMKQAPQLCNCSIIWYWFQFIKDSWIFFHESFLWDSCSCLNSHHFDCGIKTYKFALTWTIIDGGTSQCIEPVTWCFALNTRDKKCWKGDKHGIWWNKRVSCCQLLDYYNNLMFKTKVFLSHDLIRPCLKVVSI